MAFGTNGAWWPRFLHTALLAALGIGVYFVSANEPLAIAVVVAGSSLLGEVVARVIEPKRATLVPVPRPLTPAYLRRVQKDVHSEVHRLVNRLSVWMGEVDVAVDDAMRKLELEANPSAQEPTDVTL